MEAGREQGGGWAAAQVGDMVAGTGMMGADVVTQDWILILFCRWWNGVF